MPGKFYPFDRLIIGYSTLMLLLVASFGRPLVSYLDELIFYLGVIILVNVIVKRIDERRDRLWALVRLGYPVLLFTLFYEMTGGSIHLFFDNFFDWQLVAFEESVFGINPTLYIDRHLLNTWANEFFSLCYFLYYFMIIAFVVVVFRRRDDEILKSSLTALSLTFLLSFVLFFIYPVEGPRWYFADAYVNAIESPFSRKLVDMVIDNAAVRGGCMPSSHFGVGLVIQLFCFKYYRKAAWMILPIVIGLAIGTVWGRFHYVSDVVAGTLIGLGATLGVWWCFPPKKFRGPQRRSNRQDVKTHVS